MVYEGQGMSKLSEGKKAAIVGVVALTLAAVNVMPLHYSIQQNCPHGGTVTTNGITLGLPLAYFRTVHGGVSECSDFVGISPSSGFTVQALLSDGLIFGLVMVGLNVLFDRRTKA
jgi:hypothetical protein